MFSLQGYSVDLLLYESRQSRIYRGRRQADQLPVIFKVLNEDSPSPEKRARFQQEYQLMRKIDSEAILRAYSLESRQGLQIMILEDFGGTSINHLDFCASLLLHQWLDLAMRIAHALAELHRHNIIHKDINPSNIVWNCDTGQIKLIDLGIATELTREVPEIRNPDRLEGTLAYISPEQSGRMNRSMDYRTDFYSLGVTLYELLTGELPFAGGDALEIVHAHIARQAVPIEQIKPGVAGMVSAIIAKLMGKTAEERYQSAAGIWSDLETCLELLDGSGRIAPFVLGKKDFSGRLHVSQKLYGRDAQIAELMEIFNCASRGPGELLLVGGNSGTGKSALVREIQKPITRNRGVFIEGKFDQINRDIPYASISQAFNELIRQILTKGDAEVASWKTRLLSSLGNNAKVIIDVIPDLEKIIGVQPIVIDLPPAQALNRFHNEFRKFVATFATAEQPLVIFLDDLQWADLPSLQLMSQLLRAPATPHLLLIGAYRDNEITPAHALRLTLHEMEKVGVVVHDVTVQSLGIDEITQLLSDTLSVSSEAVQELAQLSLSKTQGNPFFLNQFLVALVDQNILRSDPVRGSWQWSVAEVRRAGITDNIVELMVEKLHRLPKTTQSVLQVAACLGNTFDLRMLAAVCDQSETETARRLWSALKEELIIPLDDYYKYAEQETTTGKTSLLPVYRFLHDRVHQAGYSLSSDAEKANLHLAIGRLWQQNFTLEEQQTVLFDLVNHLNRGSSLMPAAEERLALVEINLAAARRAKTSVAYKPALTYLQTALLLVDETAWVSHYDLMLAVHFEAAEVAYLSSDKIEMEQIIRASLRFINDVVDQARFHAISIQALISESRFREALHLGLEAMALLGVTFPKNPTHRDFVKSLRQMDKLLAGRPIDSLALLPDRTDLRYLAVSEISLKTCSAAYYAMPAFVPLLLQRGILLALKYGNAPTNGASYAFYGVILLGPMQKIDQAAEFGEIALRMIERPKMAIYHCRTTWTVHALLRPWKKPLRETLAPLAQGHLRGVEMSDPEFASNNAMTYVYYSFYSGQPLSELEAQLADYCTVITPMQRPSILNSVRILWQAIANLRGETDQPAVLQGQICTASQMQEYMMRSDDRTFMFKLFGTKLMLAYSFGDHHQALQYAVLTERYSDPISGFFGVSVFCFYDSLVRLALLPKMSFLERFKTLAKISENQKKMRLWANHAPANFLHKWHLVEAELARHQGKIVEANRAFDEAIRLAKKHEFMQEEALAQERAADHYLAQGIESVAVLYLLQALGIYRRWGALAKVRELAARYPQWLAEQSAVFTTSTYTTAPLLNTSTGSSTSLDLAAVLKISQAISQEIVLQNLLIRLMQLAVESAGAQRGILLLKKEATWFLEAEKAGMQTEITALQSIAFDVNETANAPLPMALFHYVSRTRESVVVHEAATDKLVASDSYVQNRQPRSLLIVPILRQADLIGILYLENSAVSGAFTESRLEVLRLLASQAAISIENARLYADMEERVAARTAELKSMALRDGLTGVSNRRAFDERLAEELGRSRRGGQPLSLLIIDIDHFKQINDRFGHPVGDRCLQQVGSTLLAQCRRCADFVARYGGEEFTMILPDTDLQGATAFAERVRAAIEKVVLEVDNIAHPITASVGVATVVPSAVVDVTMLVASADRSLYAAKAAGRNCVVSAVAGAVTATAAEICSE